MRSLVTALALSLVSLTAFAQQPAPAPVKPAPSAPAKPAPAPVKPAPAPVKPAPAPVKPAPAPVPSAPAPAPVKPVEPMGYALDMSHTSISFEVPHLVVSSVTGRFKDVKSSVVKLDEADLTKSQVTIEIKVESIATDDAKRDDHLKSPDFFDAKKFPLITFNSTKITRGGKGYKVTGDLTIRDITKPVTLDATVSAPVKSPWGKLVRAVKITGTIKRSDFGLKRISPFDSDAIVGNDVTLSIKSELVK